MLELIISFLLNRTDTPFSITSHRVDESVQEIKIQWQIGHIYDDEDAEEFFDEEGDFYIPNSILLKILAQTFKLVEENHHGFVERGTSDISEGVYRIRLHE